MTNKELEARAGEIVLWLFDIDSQYEITEGRMRTLKDKITTALQEAVAGERERNDGEVSSLKMDVNSLKHHAERMAEAIENSLYYKETVLSENALKMLRDAMTAYRKAVKGEGVA